MELPVKDISMNEDLALTCSTDDDIAKRLAASAILMAEEKQKTPPPKFDVSKIPGIKGPAALFAR